MEFSLRVTRSPDVAALERRLLDLDPSALLDLAGDGLEVRISSMATAQELLDCVRAAGVDVQAGDLVQLPSVCCGGCSG